MTTSTSSAPSRRASSVSANFIPVVLAPRGNPTTVQTLTEVLRNRSRTSRTEEGLTQTVKKPFSAASLHRSAISDSVASCCKLVWSNLRASSSLEINLSVMTMLLNGQHFYEFPQKILSHLPSIIGRRTHVVYRRNLLR